MPKFSRFLAEGLTARGHLVIEWSPIPLFYKLPCPQRFKKWLGYFDQFILFPLLCKLRLMSVSPETLFVFADHALGPWIPLVARRFHIVHCHDFLAQRSAENEFSENPLGWTGRLYQKFIRRGYQRAANFISVSVRTQADLMKFLGKPPIISEVVYNGLPNNYGANVHFPINRLQEGVGSSLLNGYILHVGGNQWYKNRIGVIEIYNAWRGITSHSLPLLLIGPSPSLGMHIARSRCLVPTDIVFLEGASDCAVRAAYAGATVFLFPSLAEGFGWPIAEAMASGCPVITTDEAPMTEVAGDSAFLIPRRPHDPAKVGSWADAAAEVLDAVMTLTPTGRTELIAKGLRNAERFDSTAALKRIEAIYEQVLKNPAS